MFPGVQMQQPRAALPPPTFDYFVASSSHEPFAVNHQYTYDGFSSTQRSFPIRTSRPQRWVPTSSESLFALGPENHLRRKTPRGTIDAGYDGSPTQLSQGPPPLKHMILPGSSINIHSYLPFCAPPSQLRPVPTPEHQQPSLLRDIEFCSDLEHSSIDSSRWGFTSNPGALPGVHHGSVHNTASSGRIYQSHAYVDATGSFPNIYQPVVRANEYNVRAFCPPPVVVNDSFSPGPMSLQNISPWSYRNPNHQDEMTARNSRQGLDPLSCNVLTPGNTIHPVFDVSTDPNRPFKPAQPSQIHLENLSLDSRQSSKSRSIVQTAGYASQTGFRERALAQAYRSYLDLLAYIQAVKKTQNTRGNLGSRPSPRSLAYPKPPKPTIPASLIIGGDQAFGFGRIASNDSGKHHHESTFGTNVPSDLGYTQHRGFKHPRNSAGVHNDLFGVNHGHDHYQQNHVTPFLTESSRNNLQTGNGIQMNNAKSSLALLTSLCEQSGWKWIDGILLGGCLHYGLDHYEEALEWFSRITALDSSHVEAITNMAATLYCLNRQDEAEQQWLKAVKLRPSYLEAVEHLVGLLYKTRSSEAIEIINYAQQSLRLSSKGSTQLSHRSLESVSKASTSHNEQRVTPVRVEDSTSPGFGSSGYAVPGRENGRILALIHAKGTMHYSLKDIKKASKAFEEAVLISTGHSIADIQHLVQRIQTALSSTKTSATPSIHEINQSRPLLLPPERARHTAHLVFGGSGELPGLRYVADGASKRAAVQTTSNSLLSLAKIFQDAMSGGTEAPNLLRRPSGVGDILALYYLSLSLQESPSTANNVGILLAGVQQGVSSSIDAGVDTYPAPSVPGITPGSGLALALAYYHYGLRLDPKHVHLHTNLGSLLKDIGQLDLAIQMYEQAVSCDGTFDIALTNLANAVKDRGRTNDAIAYYKRAVASNPDFAEAVCGLLTALNSVCDWRGRGGAFLHLGNYDRWHVDQKGQLVDAKVVGHGSGLTKRVVQIVGRQLNEASLWGSGVLNDAFILSFAGRIRHLCSTSSFQLEDALRKWMGKPWEGTRLVRLVERATRVIQWRWYRDRYINQNGASCYRRPRVHPNLTVPSAPTVLPFHTFTCPLTAKDIRVISQRNAIRISCSTLKLPWIPETVYPPPAPPRPHLNVGYVSSDFNNHPLAHLMQSVFGFHNPRRVRAFCYATTASDKSVHRQQIEREAPVFRDVSNWSPDKLVEQIVRDRIHILVNLNGYTRGARNEIFAARPAPVQMSFMGFAGTLGAEWCDYILADTTAIPPETLRPWRNNVGVEDIFCDETESDTEDWVYSENIVFCRDTFFCCDHAQSCDSDERNVTWEEEQQRRWKMRKELFPTMPNDTVILGNFNQLYKIEPTTFRSWLRILAQTPKAVLWLLRFPELGETNLRRMAKAWAGPDVASRLLFTDVAPKHQHISRARVCDLFLDTPECNAHTTAADVLWSSTPLLTLPRYPYKMCSRMAASILKGALPKSEEGQRAARDLIAKDEAEYEQIAIKLAEGLRYRVAEGGYGEGDGRLVELRKLLWDSRWQCGLFNTHRWVNDVETAYEEAWRRWVAGEGGDIYL